MRCVWVHSASRGTATDGQGIQDRRRKTWGGVGSQQGNHERPPWREVMFGEGSQHCSNAQVKPLHCVSRGSGRKSTANG